jgi:hypothetical protein
LDFIHEPEEVTTVGKESKQTRRKRKQREKSQSQVPHPDVFDFINSTCGSTAEQEVLIKSILLPSTSSGNSAPSIQKLHEKEVNLRQEMVSSAPPLDESIITFSRRNCNNLSREILAVIWSNCPLPPIQH